MFFLRYKEMVVTAAPPGADTLHERQPVDHTTPALDRPFRPSLKAQLAVACARPITWLLNRYFRAINDSTHAVIGYRVVLNHYWQSVLYPLIADRVVKFVLLHAPFQDEPPLFFVASTLRNPTTPTDHHFICRGTDADFGRAVTKSIGEVVERYPLLVSCPPELPRYSLAECEERGLDFLDIRTLEIFPDYERTRARIGDYVRHKKITWTGTRRIAANGTTVTSLVPVDLMYWRHPRGVMVDNPVLCEYSTHGSAAYPTVIGALLRSLLEWCGRDGFYHHWALGSCPDQITPASLRASNHAPLAALLQTTLDLGPYDVFFLDVTSPKVPVPSIACVLLDTRADAYPRVSVGAGCALNVADACHAALLESWGLHQWQRTHFYNSDAYKHKPQSEWGDYERLSFFGSGAGLSALTPWLSGARRTLAELQVQYGAPAADEPAQLRQLCALTAQHPDIAIYYTGSHGTTPFDHCGLYSVRSFVTGLIPPYQHRLANIPLYALRKRLDTYGTRGTAAAVRQEPHPYP